jgi:5-methylcytosine-specific restriction protein A
VSFLPFREAGTYSRKDVFTTLGLSPEPVGGNWFTGYHSHADAHFIFCNVGAAGRTGHDYGNSWEAPDQLRWFGKTHSKADQPQILAMTRGDQPVYLFHRQDNRDQFTFAGLVRAISIAQTQPVEVIWKVVPCEVRSTEEVPHPERFAEGAMRRITVNAYERQPAARAQCIEHYKAVCVVCDFRFEDVYGDIGRDFIHVHHLVPLHTIGRRYQVDPIEDLRPVCPNCHAMLHTEEPPLEIDALRARIAACAGIVSQRLIIS